MNNNIYLLYGEEKYDLNKEVGKIKKRFDSLELGINFFNINKENIEKLEEIIESTTFFGNDKLIIIKDTNLKFNVDLLKDLDKNIVVVIIEDSIDKRLTSYKTISKIANCIEFKNMDKNKMSIYIYDILKKYNLKCEPNVASYMVEVCGIDKSNIINEIKKLVIYIEKDGIVTKEVIDSICSKTLDAKIFDVLDRIINKDKINGLNMLEEILRQKESIVKVYIMLYKQIKQMYMIKCLKANNEVNIMAKLSIHPFVYKNLDRASNRYTLEKIKQIMYLFNEYDEKTKIGEMDFEIGLKKIICMM